MHKEHIIFKKPNDENIKIYRYLDFSKFVSLLDRKELFFPSAENLSKSDLYEGFFPEIIKIPGDEMWAKEIRKDICIDCWHMNDGESDAMWKLYSKNDDGIAIQSTYERLSESFNKSTNDIYIGEVEYIDYDTWKPEDGSPLNEFMRFIYKRKPFEHEKELRAVTSQKGLVNFVMQLSEKMQYEKLLMDFKKQSSGLINYIFSLDKTEKDIEKKATEIREITTKLFETKGIQSSDTELLLNILIPSETQTHKDKSDEGGIYIKADIDILIEKIYIAPGAKPWFCELVKSVLKKYGLDKEVYPSILAKEPKI